MSIDTPEVQTAQDEGKRGFFSRFPKKDRVPLSKKTKKRIVLSLLAGALALAAGFGIYRLFFAQEERVAITGTTTFGALNEAIEGSGTTTPADSVTYDVSGTVLEWHVAAGDTVAVGDLLYVLDSSDVKDEILEAEVELEELYEQRSDLRESIASQRVTAEFSGRVEGIQPEEGDNVQNNTTLATLIDDSKMKATLYFSYVYQDDVAVGSPVTVSVPGQMLTLSGTVSDVRYVDYVTPEGMKCFAATILVDNPGSLAEGTAVTCWLDTADGGKVYAVDSAKLDYNGKKVITAGASGELAGVYVVDYQRVSAGDLLFVIDASGYATQLETVQKQIDNYEEKISDLQESIATEYTRYSDIDGKVVSASYSTNRMTGMDMGSVVIYNQESMQISINVDELDADYLTEGMEVTVYRTTSSNTVFYPAQLTYLSLEATSSSSGVSTFAATITIDSQGALSSGVTVYYSIDTSGGGSTEETVLAPINALCSYDDGYYLLVQCDQRPDNAIDPAQAGGTVTDYPAGYYAVPVEAGSYNEMYIQILSGVEQDATVFLRYMNTAPSGGDKTSDVDSGDEGQTGGFPGGMDGAFPGGMGQSGGSFPSGMTGQMGGMGQSGTGGNRTNSGGGQMGAMAGGRG